MLVAKAVALAVMEFLRIRFEPTARLIALRTIIKELQEHRKKLHAEIKEKKG